MSSRHHRATTWIDRLQAELDSMTFRDPHGSFTLGQMYGKQLAMMRAAVEHHSDYERIGQASERVDVPLSDDEIVQKLIGRGEQGGY